MKLVGRLLGTLVTTLLIGAVLIALGRFALSVAYGTAGDSSDPAAPASALIALLVVAVAIALPVSWWLTGLAGRRRPPAA